MSPRRWAAVVAVAFVPLAFAGLFIAALPQLGEDERIPAAIVNGDEMVTTTAPDGTEQRVLAGRQLVTELTGPDAEGFDWRITNADDAERALAAGEVYAVLTVPADFSRSITSLAGDTPEVAQLELRTDDAHDYLTGSLAQSVGDGMAGAFGAEVTEQYLAGVYASLDELGGSLNEATGGAQQLATGADALEAGLGELAAGAGSARQGAEELAAGVGRYTDGVDSLSAGLGRLSAGAQALDGVASGVADYTGGVSALSAQLSRAAAALAANPIDPVAQATVQELSRRLAGVAASGPTLSGRATGGVDEVQAGLGQSASGAATLAAGSASLDAGAASLAGGLTELGAAAERARSGAADLESGSNELASGLSAGTAQLPASDGAQAEAAAATAANPVTTSVTRDNEVSQVDRIVSTLFVPLGLWLGAFAAFLVLRPLGRRALASSASHSRLLGAAFARAALITAAQAVLLTALLHLVVGLDASLLPATLGIALLMALAFTAFHQLLGLVFGRAGLVLSLLLLALQLTATGGLYPVQLLAEPFRLLSPLLPLTHGVAAMQALMAGGAIAPLVSASLALLGFGVASVLLSALALRRTRHAAALGLLPASA